VSGVELDRRGDFADVSLSTLGLRACVGAGAVPGDHESGSGDPPARRLTASGSGRVDFTYTPEPTDRSTKIVFIQVMRELLDGTPVRPSAVDPRDSYLDADTTSDMDHVDSSRGERDPYYNGDDGNDSGDRGDATSTPPRAATMDDRPDVPNLGQHNNVRFEFRTAAFSAAGADEGTYYAYADWIYSRTATTFGDTSIIGIRAGDPGSRFRSAVARFCSNHGFTMPGAASYAGTGALIGLGAGAATGAAIGAFGGPIGALIGGLIGAGVGAIAGAIAGSQVQRP